MATCQDIIRRALRSMGVLGGGQEPTGADAEDGLERLQSLVLNLPGLIQNGVWHECATSTAATAAREDHRYTVTSPGTVVLPAVVTCEGYSRPPHDLAKVQIVGAGLTNSGIWIYSATKAGWGKLDGLKITDELPFGDEDDQGLAAMLAVNWSDEFGATATVTKRTDDLAAQSSRSFRARFKKYERRPHHHHFTSYAYEELTADGGDIADVADEFEGELDFPL